MSILSQNEWDFSPERISKQELPWCFRYEYARDSDIFLEYTNAWREQHKDATQHFASAIQTLGAFAESGGLDSFPRLADVIDVFFTLKRAVDAGAQVDLPEEMVRLIEPVFDSRFLNVLPHLTKLYEAIFGRDAKQSRMLHTSCQMDFNYLMVLDERFPQRGYLDSEFMFRRLKFFLLNQFFAPEMDSILDSDSRLAIKGRAFWETSHLHAGFDAQNPDSGTTMQGQFAQQCFVGGVNWARSNDAIIAEFREWLVQERPHPPYDQSRRTNERDLLKALGALRLRRVMSWEEARRHTKEVLGYPLYSGAKSWKRAVAKADAQAKEPFVPFSGLLALRTK